jgi:elongation factor Ts
MANYTTADIAELREQTSMGLMDVKKALDEANGDKKQALALLKERGAHIMAKKADRTASEGVVDAYVHGGRIGVVVEVNCETDFVARGDDFKNFAHELAMQIAAMSPANVEELLAQDNIRGGGSVADRLAEVTGKLGERIVISRFTRMELGRLDQSEE